MMSISLNQIVPILLHKIKQMNQLIDKLLQILKKRLQKYRQAQILMLQIRITDGLTELRHFLQLEVSLSMLKWNYLQIQRG